VLRGEELDTYRYKITVVGAYHPVSTFLANVGSLPRIVAPINLSLVLSSKQTTERKPAKGEQFLEARLQIQTFVVHPSPKPASGAGGQQ